MHFDNFSLRNDRVSCCRTVRLERTADCDASSNDGSCTLTGLTLNVSNYGVCVLLDWFPRTGEVLRIHMPMPVPSSHTPTLADVRWVNVLPFRGRDLAITGLKFLV